MARHIQSSSRGHLESVGLECSRLHPFALLLELLAEMMALNGNKNGDKDARELVEEIEGEISCLEKGLWLLSNMLV